MNEVLGAIVTITKIGQDGHRPSKEDLAMQLLLIVALGLAILTVILHCKIRFLLVSLFLFGDLKAPWPWC